MRAYVDESVRVAAPGLYVLAAVTVSLDEAEEVRAVLRESLSQRQRRFHWRAESAQRREAMAKIVSVLALPGLVVITSPIDPRRRERARRVALTRLLWELEQRQVFDVLFESRQEIADQADRSHIGTCQRAGHVNRQLRYGFGQPLAEPLLWLPDLLAGATTTAYDRRGVECLSLLDPTTVDAGPGN